MIGKRAFVAAGVMFGALLVAAPAFATTSYPPATGNLTVSSGTAAAGGAVTVSGSGCAPSTTVDFTVGSASAGSTTADASGGFSASVTLPTSASGTVTVNSTCTDPTGGSLVLSANVTISGTLPKTGASGTSPMVAIALIALCVGSAFVVAARRRSTARARTSTSA